MRVTLYLSVDRVSPIGSFGLGVDGVGSRGNASASTSAALACRRRTAHRWVPARTANTASKSRAPTVLGQYIDGAKLPKHRDSSFRSASADARALRVCASPIR